MFGAIFTGGTQYAGLFKPAGGTVVIPSDQRPARIITKVTYQRRTKSAKIQAGVTYGKRN